MNISQQFPLKTDFDNLPKPELDTQSPDAAQQMESLFVSLMLKEMRQAGSDGGLFPGDSSDTFGGMFDLYLGNFIAESGGIGLADSVRASLGSQ